MIHTRRSANVVARLQPALSGATSYLIQARTGPGAKFGSLANATTSSATYTFTGLSAGGEVQF